MNTSYFNILVSIIYEIERTPTRIRGQGCCSFHTPVSDKCYIVTLFITNFLQWKQKHAVYILLINVLMLTMLNLLFNGKFFIRGKHTQLGKGSAFLN